MAIAAPPVAAAPVEITRSRPETDGWTYHELSAPAFAIREKPRGRDRFRVLEPGAGRRGMARLRGTASSLAAALDLAGSLERSTTAEILAGVTAYLDLDRRRLAELRTLGQPGVRLFVSGGEAAYEAVSEGLAVNRVEAVFGDDDLHSWLIAWRDPAGELCSGLYVSALEDAQRAWWILRDGKVVAGGPPIYDEARSLELAAKYGGCAVLGTGWAA